MNFISADRQRSRAVHIDGAGNEKGDGSTMQHVSRRSSASVSAAAKLSAIQESAARNFHWAALEVLRTAFHPSSTRIKYGSSAAHARQSGDARKHRGLSPHHSTPHQLSCKIVQEGCALRPGGPSLSEHPALIAYKESFSRWRYLPHNCGPGWSLNTTMICIR